MTWIQHKFAKLVGEEKKAGHSELSREYMVTTNTALVLADSWANKCLCMSVCGWKVVNQSHWSHYLKGVWPFINSWHHGIEICKILLAKKPQCDAEGPLMPRKKLCLPKLSPGFTSRKVVHIFCFLVKHFLCL